MDFCQNVTAVPGDQYQPDSSSSKLSSNPLDDLFPSHNTEVDVSLEWLSIFVEDCLSSSGICLPASELPTNENAQIKSQTTPSPTPKSPEPKPPKAQETTPPLEKFVVPVKARSKRKRAAAGSSNTKVSSLLTSWTNHHNPSAAAAAVEDTQVLLHSDPPLLLHQAHWLADSQLLSLPKKETTITTTNKKKVNSGDDAEEEEAKEAKQGEMVMMRRCSHCLAQRTPQWRAGPMGPKTLCNACGVRYKSGRLLPEYRPAKSPTFVSNVHSNSHKKVLEMRMSVMPSSSSSSSSFFTS